MFSNSYLQQPCPWLSSGGKAAGLSVPADFRVFSVFRRHEGQDNYCVPGKVIEGKKAVTARPRRRTGSDGLALKQLVPLLLRVAGRKVLVIIILAVARTALSNRLARLQVIGSRQSACISPVNVPSSTLRSAASTSVCASPSNTSHVHVHPLELHLMHQCA